MQLLPEARIPAVNQVSSMVTSSIGINARYCATKVPLALCSIAPTIAQSACRMPEEVNHFPDSTMPPCTRRVFGDGENTPDTRASGFAPNTSSCAFFEKSAANHAHTFVNATTQEVPPQASPRAA